MPHSTGRVTIKDVAQAAGVSTQTVSRVINNRPDVAPETFARVKAVIEQTGYEPNVLARSLIRGRSHTLGVVAYGLDYFGPSRVLTGIESQAAALGYSIFLHLIHQPEAENIERVLNSLFARQVDGIIWAIPEIGDNRAWAMAHNPEFPVPVAFVNGRNRVEGAPLVGIDNRAIGQLATAHLVAGGSRHIGIITGPMDWWESQERRRGWQETLEAKGLEAGERMEAAGNWDASSGSQGLYQLLVQCPELDAVFASNDQMALGVLHAAHRLGRSVPDDLAVVGVDNIPESAHFWPPLSTVRQRLRQAGSLIVDQADYLIQEAARGRRKLNAPPPLSTLLQPELIVRDSSRSAPP
jgi:LacI family transcriptional regulator